MFIPTFSAKIIKGKIRIFDKKRFAEWLKKIKDKPLVLVIKPKEKQRTELQNNLMWLWWTFLENETGESKDKFHLHYKKKFLSKRQMFMGRRETVTGSTTELNTKTFGEFLEKVEADVAIEFHVILPHPEEYYQSLN